MPNLKVVHHEKNTGMVRDPVRLRPGEKLWIAFMDSDGHSMRMTSSVCCP